MDALLLEPPQAALHYITAFILIDEHGIVRDLNAAVCDLLGYAVHELLNMPLQDLCKDPNCLYFLHTQQTLFLTWTHKNQTDIDCELSVEKLSGHWLLTLNKINSSSPLSLSNKDPFRLLSTLSLAQTLKDNDIIHQKMEKNEKRFRLLAENATDMISQQTLQGVYLYVSPSCRSLLGYEPEQLVGKNAYDYFHELDRTKIENLNSGITPDTHSLTITHRFRKKDGNYVWFETIYRYIKNKNNNMLMEIHSTSRDISARILEERARLKSQKIAKMYRLNTMEEMASGIAHEVNQPLAAVVNYTRGCVRYIENHKHLHDRKLLEIMEKAVLQAERAGEIVHRLKHFFSKGELYKAPEKINGIIKESVEFLKKDIVSQKVKLVYRLGRKLPAIQVDRLQIQQVILNLLQNAMEAMEEIHSNKRQITIKTTCCNNMIEIIICDTGPGFAPELQEKVYRPFFTTKKTGTGMGLPISRSIVQAHNGSFMIRSPKYNKEGWVCFSLPIGKR